MKGNQPEIVGAAQGVKSRLFCGSTFSILYGHHSNPFHKIRDRLTSWRIWRHFLKETTIFFSHKSQFFDPSSPYFWPFFRSTGDMFLSNILEVHFPSKASKLYKGMPRTRPAAPQRKGSRDAKVDVTWCTGGSHKDQMFSYKWLLMTFAKKTVSPLMLYMFIHFRNRIILLVHRRKDDRDCDRWIAKC